MRRIWGLTVAAVVIVATTAGTAWADKDDPFDEHRMEIGIGMLAGGFDVGPISGPGVGLRLDVGRQMGDFRVFGEYDFLSIGESTAQDPDAVRGILHRGGAGLRYNFVDFGGGSYKPVQGAFWIEGGLGYEHIRWDAGGKLSREDASLGLGLQANFKLGNDKPKFIGFFYAFRATVARAPDNDKMPEEPPTCGGPCDEPTGPAPYDLGLFFNMGLNWGR